MAQEKAQQNRVRKEMLINSKTELMRAIKANNTSLVKEILTAAGDVNLDFLYEKTTPLTQACIQRNYLICNILLKNGANPNIEFGPTVTRPLHLIASADDHESLNIAELLLSNGAILDFYNVLRITALQKACMAGAVEMVKLLLKHGASVADPLNSGLNSLHLTAKATFAEDTKLKILELLIQQNCNIDLGSLRIEPEEKKLIEPIIDIYKKIGNKTKGALREPEEYNINTEYDTEVEEGTLLTTITYEYEPVTQNVEALYPADAEPTNTTVDEEPTTTTTTSLPSDPVGPSFVLEIDWAEILGKEYNNDEYLP